VCVRVSHANAGTMASAPAPAPAPLPRVPTATLGRTGLLVSRLSLGSWVTFHNQVSIDTAYALLKAAYARGVFTWDNAEVYAKGEAERLMGEAFARGVAEGVWAREDLVITTKLFFGTRDGPNAKGLSRKHIVEGMRASLARLGTVEYVDVVFAHRPDPVTPIEETVRAFAHLIDRGQALYWGTSEWSASQITEAIAAADRLGLPRPVTEQPEYSLVARSRVEVEYAGVIAAHGVGLTTWSPLASGVLTGKYSGGVVPPGSRLSLEQYDFLAKAKLGSGADSWQLEAADALAPIAEELGCSRAALAIAWCLLNPAVSTVILGATSLAQLEDNLTALDVVPKLTPEVVARVEAAAARGKPVTPKVEVQVAGVRATAGIFGFERRS
jgi:voltage-dependent potassium channel beta subunit